MFRSIYLALILVLLSVTSIESACSKNADCRNDGGNDWGEYSECVDGICKCSEFFIVHPIDDFCIKASSYGKPCEYKTQCQGILGNDATCNSEKICECSSITFPDDVFHHEGRCYVRKGLGEPCTEDNQCIFDSNFNATNPLARCVDKVCSCIQDDQLSLDSADEDGICVVQHECDTYDISLLAIMLAGSVVLILFIYTIFRLTQIKRKSNAA